MEGPLNIADMGLAFMKGQIRDLDLVGRENAERSSDIKLALMKGWLRELEKGPSASPAGLDPAVVDNLAQAAQKASDMAAQASETVAAQSNMISRLEETNSRLEAQLTKYEEDSRLKERQQAELLEKTQRILEEVRAYNERDPLTLRTIKEALRNIQAEKKEVRARMDGLESDGTSDGEMEAHQKILSLKEKTLDKNLEDLGKSVSKEANSVEDALDALDELGI